MIAVDSNILVYAHRLDSPFHSEAASLVTALAEGSRDWAIPWPCVHEFLAVTTNRRAFVPPTSVEAALEFIGSLLERDRISLLGETGGYWTLLRNLLAASQVTGGRIHDARIAALCLEHGVSELWTADRDFSRFPQLRVTNPLVAR